MFTTRRVKTPIKRTSTSSLKNISRESGNNFPWGNVIYFKQEKYQIAICSQLTTLQVSSGFILTFETDPQKYARAVWKHRLLSGKVKKCWFYMKEFWREFVNLLHTFVEAIILHAFPKVYFLWENVIFKVSVIFSGYLDHQGSLVVIIFCKHDGWDSPNFNTTELAKLLLYYNTLPR